MRVIQDSDDEFDDDLQDEVQSPRTGDASRDHGKDASSLESGTGSTGKPTCYIALLISRLI
jgi:hypothetical protein